MNKIKETITALTNCDTNAVRVSRKESVPLSEECFRIAVKCIDRTASIVAAAYVIANADVWKILAVITFGVIYLMMKD